MAPLAHTLALLALTVATVAIEVVPLNMTQDTFDDQYRGCGPAMTAALPALNCSDFQQNPLFARVWPQAVADWQRKGSPVSPLSSPAQAITLMAYTMDDLYQKFNNAVRMAGRSPQEYRDNFHFKTLHFLLTDALATLRNAQKGQCCCVYREVNGFQFKARRGQTVRFSQFASTSVCKHVTYDFGMDTVFKVNTSYGMDIQNFSKYHNEREVLVPPFETFEVTEVTQKGNREKIELRSTGTSSKYNCEWLKAGSIPRAPFHLGGLLLATTALAVATRTL